MTLSRVQRDALARQDAPFLAAPLRPADPRSFEAHVRQAARLLRDRQTSASPSARAVRHVVELFERSVPESARAQLACASGCAFCCYQPVRVTAAEAFFLAGQLRERPETEAAVRAAADMLSDRQADAPKVAWLRCPLLDADNGCSAYAARPLNCHAYVSVNVEDCKAVEAGAVVMEPAPYKTIKEGARVMLQAALRANGLPDTSYELNAALRAVLDTDHAEKRWLRGEDIFAQVPQVSPNNAQAEKLIAWVAANIAPTL